MKRDMDLIRKILIQLESYSTNDDIRPIELEGYSHEQIAYHVYLLKDANLILATILFDGGSVAPKDYSIFGLTWAGHDFLDACRDEGRWNKAKQMAAKLGSGVTFDVMKTLLVQIMTSQIPTLIASGV